MLIHFNLPKIFLYLGFGAPLFTTLLVPVCEENQHLFKNANFEVLRSVISIRFVPLPESHNTFPAITLNRQHS
jgi:hypothetical protein